MMYRKLILITILIVLPAMTIPAHRHEARSATSTVGWPPEPIVKFVPSTEKPFDQLMEQAMSVMHRGMHNAAYTGEHDRDFVTMMIPHHQGAIDMALVVLKYGRDEKLKRLAQSIIVEQGQEIAYMRSLLAPPSGVAGNIHPASGQ